MTKTYRFTLTYPDRGGEPRSAGRDDDPHPAVHGGLADEAWSRQALHDRSASRPCSSWSVTILLPRAARPAALRDHRRVDDRARSPKGVGRLLEDHAGRPAQGRRHHHVPAARAATRRHAPHHRHRARTRTAARPTAPRATSTRPPTRGTRSRSTSPSRPATCSRSQSSATCWRRSPCARAHRPHRPARACSSPSRCSGRSGARPAKRWRGELENERWHPARREEPGVRRRTLILRSGRARLRCVSVAGAGSRRSVDSLGGVVHDEQPVDRHGDGRHRLSWITSGRRPQTPARPDRLRHTARPERRLLPCAPTGSDRDAHVCDGGRDPLQRDNDVHVHAARSRSRASSRSRTRRSRLSTSRTRSSPTRDRPAADQRVSRSPCGNGFGRAKYGVQRPRSMRTTAILRRAGTTLHSAWCG